MGRERGVVECNVAGNIKTLYLFVFSDFSLSLASSQGFSPLFFLFIITFIAVFVVVVFIAVVFIVAVAFQVIKIV